MALEPSFDIIIIGGGLAGLSAGILAATDGHKVLLLEKEYYPKHKVCGEYISNESLPFLKSLGVDTDGMQLPEINKLVLTTTYKAKLKALLPLGGFGISRYKLDKALADIYVERGGTLMTKHKVDTVQWLAEGFTVTAGNTNFSSRLVLGSWGKRSNLDTRLARNFIQENQRVKNQYVGVKYHVAYKIPDDEIGLHIFDGGYCGISKIEEGTCCLCYLVEAKQVKKFGSIEEMEAQLLMKNMQLMQIWNGAKFLYPRAETIAQISFEQKEQIIDHVLMLGDAAGLIAPLSGNGMSMAMHSAKIAYGFAHDFLSGKISRQQMEEGYKKTWRKTFRKRLATGKWLQEIFFSNARMAWVLSLANALPFVKKQLIKSTHGAAF